MNGMMKYRTKIIAVVVLLLLVVGVIVIGGPVAYSEWGKTKDGKVDGAGADKLRSSIRLEGPQAIHVEPETVAALGVKAEPAKTVTQGECLELVGSLAPDTDRLLPVRSRFAGEVIQVAEILDPDPNAPTSHRTVSTSDKVRERQLLAVVWCKDLGEKKSELIGALAQLALDEATLKSYKEVNAKIGGTIPAQTIRERETMVATDRIAVARADATLRSWRLTNDEITAIYQEAERVIDRVRKGEKAHTREEEENWARVEVWAPFEGTVLERNITKGSIVDTTTNLFMLGDLSRLYVFAWAYQEDLPRLQTLPKPVAWSVELKADPKWPAMQGTVKEIGRFVDPIMKTALVKGMVLNPEGRLLSGQDILARVPLPAPENQVAVPMTALIENGQESIVFVQPDPKQPVFAMRKVAVARRTEQTAYIHTALTPKQAEKGLQPVKPGDQVVVSGALILRAGLSELQEAHKAGK